MNIIILGGFLGAGKTTLLLQMAKYLVGEEAGSSSKVVVLENEIGEVSIDDKVLKNDGLEVSTMFSGCVCCTTAGELVSNVYQVQQKFHPQWLIIEATGVAYPLKIKENLMRSIRAESCQIFCVADAGRWMRLKKVMTAFMHDQLDGADVIFINKTDQVDEAGREEVAASVNEFQPNSKKVFVSAASPIHQEVWQDVFEEGSL